jgi:hypothetical protein
MPRQPSSRTEPTPELDAFPGGLTGEQIGRLAAMIADGRCECPHDLQPADRERLRGEARRRLRDRLVRFIARAVAQHLRTAGQPTEVSDNA